MDDQTSEQDYDKQDSKIFNPNEYVAQPNGKGIFEHVTEGCQCKGKACTKCGKMRCYSAFSRDKRLKSGLKSQCKICHRNECKAWHQAHIKHDVEYRQAYRDHYREIGRAYYRNNRERYRDYRLAHSQSQREYKKSWWQNNREHDRVRREARKERINEQRKIRYHNNPDRAKERSRAYKQTHPEYNKNYSRANPELIRRKTAHRRARKKKAPGTYTVEQWEALKVRYEYTCLCCGRKEPEIKLSIDHVVPLTMGGDNTINNIQPLCLSCNSAKRTRIIDYRKG